MFDGGFQVSRLMTPEGFQLEIRMDQVEEVCEVHTASRVAKAAAVDKSRRKTRKTSS